MVSVRTNLVPNPRYIGSDGKGGGGSASWDQEDVATGGPDDRGWTRVIATSVQTGAADVGTDVRGTAAVVAGETYTASTHMLAEATPRDAFHIYIGWQDATGAGVGTSTTVTLPNPPVDAWQRLSVTGVAPAGAVQAQVRARFISGSNPMQPGQSVGVGCRLLEEGVDLLAYYDGDTPDTASTIFDWTGEANNSTSTATTIDPPSITATVLTREIPVTQVVVDDLPAGVDYVVIGQSGQNTWPVAGGVGTSTGEQIVLVDARAPFNVPVTYQLTTSTNAYALSNTVMLPLADHDVVLATLDGSIEAVPNSLGAGDFPRAVTPRVQVYDVPGRARGPVRWSLAAKTGSTWHLHCDQRASADLEALLATGRPIVYRLATRVRDLPPSDLFVVTEVESVSFPDEDAWRTWTINFEYIDDPEPSTKPVVTSWDQFDQIYADSTWDEFDAQWADRTWDDFDAFDWGQLL